MEKRKKWPFVFRSERSFQRWGRSRQRLAIWNICWLSLSFEICADVIFKIFFDQSDLKFMPLEKCLIAVVTRWTSWACKLLTFLMSLLKVLQGLTIWICPVVFCLVVLCLEIAIICDSSAQYVHCIQMHCNVSYVPPQSVARFDHLNLPCWILSSWNFNY